MSLNKALLKATIDSDLKGMQESTKKINTPPEFRARLELDDIEGGYFQSLPRTAGELPDAVELFKDFDLNPDVWQIVSVRKSRWQQREDGEFLESARVTVKPAILSGADKDLDFNALVKEISNWKPNKTKTYEGNLYAIYAIGDTQYGKDSGGGTEATVKRVLLGLEESVARHKELLKMGRKIKTVVLPQLGDCIEGNVSQSGRVTGRSDLGVTQQVRIGRRVLLAWIKAFAPLCDELIIPVVPGNHDETTRQTLTDPIDSWQIEVVSAVQMAVEENSSLSHVKFMYPRPDHGTLAVDLGGSILGMAHGHQKGDMSKWLPGQATGRTPVGSADVLITGHFHHFRADQVGPRLWIQVPAMDGGSGWFRDKTGLESPTGIVSLVMGPDYDPRRDLAVLAGEGREP